MWNNWLDEPTEEFTESQLAEHDKQIRADAIDEFARLVIEEGKKRKYLRHIWIEQTCNKIAEQLKEQSNES